MLKLDNFVKLGQVMATGGMKMRLFAKHMDNRDDEPSSEG